MNNFHRTVINKIFSNSPYRPHFRHFRFHFLPTSLEKHSVLANILRSAKKICHFISTYHFVRTKCFTFFIIFMLNAKRSVAHILCLRLKQIISLAVASQIKKSPRYSRHFTDFILRVKYDSLFDNRPLSVPSLQLRLDIISSVATV